MLTLQPPRMPRPTELPIWEDGYDDIQAWILKHGYFEIIDIWLPASDDGWASFCSEHGDHYFYMSHNELRDIQQNIGKTREQRLYEEEHLRRLKYRMEAERLKKVMEMRKTP